MKSLLTAKDVLSDIEFELVQGAISRDELGQGIQAVKQHQNKVRNEVLQPASRVTDWRENAARQFQINDMLLTLLQEMAAALQSVRAEIRRAIRLSQGTIPASPVVPASTSEIDLGTSFAKPASIQVEFAEGTYGRDTCEVENAMRPDAIFVGLDVRSSDVPILGGLVKWLKINLHNLSVFYVSRLADRQSSVNRAYGDWILYLNRLNLEQQDQIELLNAQVASLQSRLNELERSSGRPTQS